MNHGYINEQDGILWWFNGILYGGFLIGSNDCSKNDDLGNNIPLWEMGLHTSVQMVSLIEASVVEPISLSGWFPILSIQNPKILHQEGYLKSSLGWIWVDLDKCWNPIHVFADIDEKSLGRINFLLVNSQCHLHVFWFLQISQSGSASLYEMLVYQMMFWGIYQSCQITNFYIGYISIFGENPL